MATRPNRYRSGLEEEFSKILKDAKIPFTFETERLRYVEPEQTHIYTPDFLIKKKLYIETKGRLTAADRKKMKLVCRQHPDKSIVMVFDRASKRIAKGSKTTYAMWCQKNNIQFVELKQIKEDPTILCQSFMTKSPKDGSS